MALNFTVSYTFSPSTTISSSQVNTNTNDVAAVFQGVEAGTKTFSQIKIDSDPTTALQVPTKQYVDHYSTYRRPVLVYSSASAVNMETGINGTSGQAQILFPDGSIRTDSTASRINLDITRVAALSGTAQSGIRTGSVSASTWYACYAVKVSDSTTNFVMVCDTVLPLQTNYATLNSNFGTSSWVYLGMIRYGDNSGATTSILAFFQAGGVTIFYNACVGSSRAMHGSRLASTAGATTLTYNSASGTGAAQIPLHLSLVQYMGASGGAAATRIDMTDSGSSFYFASADTTTRFVASIWAPAPTGIKLANSTATSVTSDINIGGFVDGVLGVGSNPLL